MRHNILDVRLSDQVRAGLTLLILSTFIFGNPAAAGVASLQARWTQPRITACFIGDDLRHRDHVVELTQSWVQGTGLEVDFGQGPGHRTCQVGSRDNIRISFRQGVGNWSALGRQAAESSVQETMNFDLDGLDPVAAKHETLHEIGHALGLLHQEQNPRYACRNEILGRYAAKLGYIEFVRPVVPDDGKYVVSAFDVQSVMRAFTSAEHFTQGKSSPCQGPPVTALSKDDRDLITRLYPPRPPDVSAATKNESISIVLDGALSHENFQQLIPELRKLGLVGLRQYIDAEGLRLTDVLVREGVLPVASVSKEFERYLCNENPHACTLRGGSSAIWSNQRAVANTSVALVECGSKSLSKSVICLPNVRVHTERVFVESRYEPTKLTLAQHVIQNTRGCNEWNDACRAIVELSNPQLDQRVYSAKALDGRAVTLTLPGTIYRVPVEYASPEAKKAIVSVVEDVKRQRAKQLGVDASDIAIRLVSPIGNPVTQAYRGFMKEPVRGYAEALTAMNFPFRDEAAEKEFERYAEVQVALWDRRVDTVHCEFERPGGQLLFVTPFPRQQRLDPAPPQAGECGKERLAEIKPTEWWDHGTHVAGILAAQINGKAIAGVNPKMTIWSWELVDGDQFNSGDDPFLAAMGHRIDPKIINISQTFERGSDLQTTALETMLFGAGQRLGAHNRRLIVAAAGVGWDELRNPAGRKIDEAFGCTLVPACWSQTVDTQKPRNLISVVALDSKGERVLKIGDRFGSNYGDMFDVAAVGAVTSTMHGNWLGPMAGSSMAAPYVTGLASLIEGKARGLDRDAPPALIKERILVTADRNTADLKASSRYGRINFERALDFTNDVLTLKRTSGCTECTLRGEMVKAVSAKVRINYPPFRNATPVNKEIPLINVRRLVVDADGITVHFIEDSRLRTASGGQLLDPDSTLSVAGRMVKLENIEDLTVASFRN